MHVCVRRVGGKEILTTFCNARPQCMQNVNTHHMNSLLSLKRSTASEGQAAQRLESILITVTNVEEEMTGGETTS